MKRCHLGLLAVVIASTACASKSKPQGPLAAEETSRKSLSQRLDQKNGYKKDANGNWVPQNDKRSPFENQGEAAYFKKDFKKQEFKTTDHAKKSFWGNKSYDRKAYGGETDGSRFQTPSKLQAMTAQESGNNAKLTERYQTDSYATSTAREAGKGPIARPANDAIENRQKAYDQPEIIDWREQRSLSLDQSKGMLGR